MFVSKNVRATNIHSYYPSSVNNNSILISKMNSITLLVVIVVVCLASVSAFRPASAKAGRMTSALNADIVDTAVSAGSFKTLAAAVTAAGLVPTLKGPGPFTVFAPTDAAFAKVCNILIANILQK